MRWLQLHIPAYFVAQLMYSQVLLGQCPILCVNTYYSREDYTLKKIHRKEGNFDTVDHLLGIAIKYN